MKKKKKISKIEYGVQKTNVKNILMFCGSLFLMSLIIIRGENIWRVVHNFIFALFGICCVLIPILGAIWVIADTMGKISNKFLLKYWISVMGIFFLSAAVYIFVWGNSQNLSLGFWKSLFQECVSGKFNFNSGFIGAILGAFAVWGFGLAGAKATALIILFLLTIFLTGAKLSDFLKAVSDTFFWLRSKIDDYVCKKKSEKSKKIEEKEILNDEKLELLNSNSKFPSDTIEDETPINFSEENDDILKVTEKFLSKDKNNQSNFTEKNLEEKNDIKFSVEKSLFGENKENYEFPPINLLNSSVDPDDHDISFELSNNGKILVDTLKSFNVQTKIVDISRGPAVTRYELQPAAGVKISKITTLADDIALNLAASGVRIEAPIPGKAAVGVEIPNKVVSVVNMKELISSSKFISAGSKLSVVLGRDISGDIMITDLAKMPHLLIAGSTGSGKSVCINSFIISILYKARPDEVKLLMIDPKVVELGIYNGIPHLLVPVVTDARKAAGALNWAVNEMLLRYKKFAENNVRDLESYNKFIDSHPLVTDKEGEILEKMPQIVIIIDELSDLMMAAPREVEDYVCRLAQMARAAGMHIVIATQRPSVDVITGIIKANIPSRIALAVSSQIDSRTILDMSGAEKLLGRGDMLFSPVGSSKPIRVQGCYVTDGEIENVIKFLKNSQESSYDVKIAEEIEKNAVTENSKNDESASGENSLDSAITEAIKCVVEAGQASTSFLQRKLRVGYARAGRLMDEMEQLGVVGPYEGSKPRQVLINYQQFLEMDINKKN